MAKTTFLSYTIYLSDAAQVAELQGAQHAGGAVGSVVMSPAEAATLYSAPIQEESSPMTAPCIRSEWFTTGNNFPRDQRTFDRCTGGWFGICFLFGSRTNFYWRGSYKWVPKIDPAVAPTGGVKVAMAKRRWTDGAEWPDKGEGGSGQGTRPCRAASRHIQGYGYKFDSCTDVRTHLPTESGGAATNQQWDRFYARVHRFPTTKSRLWRTSGSVSGTAGIELAILASGQLVVVNIDNVGTETILGTVGEPLKVHTWYKLDLLSRYATGAAGVGGYFGLYINGVLTVDLQGVWATIAGLGQIQNIASTNMGNPSGNTCCWDWDDWIGSELPTGTSLTPSFVGTFPGLDWNNGSAVMMLSAEAYGSDNAASWAAAGDWRLLKQRSPKTSVGPPAVLSNSASGARLTIRTDASREVDNTLGQLGIASMTIGVYSFEAGAISGSLGYRLPGGAAVMAAVTQDGANYAWRQVWYQPSMNDPIHPCSGLEVIFDHGVAATAQRVQYLGAVAEVIGVFGPEDVVPGATNQFAVTEDPAPTINLASQTVDYVTATKAQCVRDGLVLTGPCGAFEITKRVAWGLKHEGAGLLDKPSGNNCGGYAVDQVAFPSGRIVDILSDAGNANGPLWSEGTPVAADRFRDAVDPGDAGTVSAGPPAHLGIHNAPYPHSQWARRGTPPFSPVVVHTGTYVGTSTFVDLLFRAPVNFLFIRAVTGGLAPWLWWSSLNAGHLGGAQGLSSWMPGDAQINPAFPPGPPALDAQEQQTVVRILGNGSDSNFLATVYQYVAFSDPGMRFCNAGALDVVAGANDYVTRLDNEAFTPEAVFVQQEIANGGATVGLFYKGVGHGASNCSALNAAEIAGLAMSKGALTYKTALASASASQFATIAFRQNDSSGDVGVPRCPRITTYTGDGSASRTLGIPMGGRRPVFAIVVPHNGAAVYRDPAHTGLTSTTFPTSANASTGITGGGIDSLSLGSALNTNAIVYDVFVIPGDTVAGNGGFSQNGEFIPVAPETPGGGDLAGFGLWDAQPPDPELFPDEPDDSGGVVDPTAPTLVDGLTGTDFGTDCVIATTFIVNQALSKIGVSKQIGNILTELSTEATTARLHYVRDVEATLRGFPWPFATRYARLVLVAGTEAAGVNGDWRYAYRVPSDAVFVRRIVNATLVGRDYDTAPTKFRLGSDATGALLYTNESPTSGQPGNIAPELEYTIRTSCAAVQGDALFRQALVWKHAASLAPALSKDSKKEAFCLQMFERTIITAQVAAANESQQAATGDADWIVGRD